ncbi:MAG: flagellar basal body-associated protein FliL [Burkholderiaceae bacterium]|nr:flagellar basal body-associated protein FliL [Burkholderiaceae bacterium]
MANAEKSADNLVTAITDARPRSGKKLILIGAAALLLAGGGAGAWWMMRGGPGAAHAEKPKPPAAPLFVELEPFTVNLAGDHVLQTSVSLQVATSEDADQLKLYQPVVKSRMLLLLSSKTAEALQAPQGKEALAAEVADALKQPYVKGLTPPAIGGVYLTAFVIQ